MYMYKYCFQLIYDSELKAPQIVKISHVYAVCAKSDGMRDPLIRLVTHFANDSRISI